MTKTSFKEREHIGNFRITALCLKWENSYIQFKICFLNSHLLSQNKTDQGVHVSQFKPPVVPTDIDPFPLFMEEGVQTILNDITGIDLKKTALLQPKKLPLKPVLRAVPDKELKRLQADSFKKERSKIEQRPPFMRARKEISRELARNPEIAPVMTNNLLFIDTSAFTRSERANKDKVVVVRDTEGTLRTATQEERDRAIQIAFPVRGRTIFPSSFFKPENLHNALQRCRYSYVLDKVCVQYDPDHPEFLRYEFTCKN
uniref:28S ribosomal protein S22, mitochondrial n=1 Tax=Magallana gigas TaxID=29159 RepID=K1RHC7_MAGGI